MHFVCLHPLMTKAGKAFTCHRERGKGGEYYGGISGRKGRSEPNRATLKECFSYSITFRKLTRPIHRVLTADSPRYSRKGRWSSYEQVKYPRPPH
jgi:hypothetical protein